MSETQEARWIEIVPGIRRRTLAADQRMMQIVVELDAGARLPEHSHPHEQITYLVRGKLRFMVGGVAREVGPGEAVMLPSGVPHAVDVLEEALAIDTFSPPREDMLAQDRG